MEKINFNGHIFDLVPMGISCNAPEKRRTLSFQSGLTYAEIEAILKDTANIGSIQYQSEAGETLATYSDCVSLKVLSKDIETGVYTAEFSTDETAKKLADMQAEIEKLKATKKDIIHN